MSLIYLLTLGTTMRHGPQNATTAAPQTEPRTDRNEGLDEKCLVFSVQAKAVFAGTLLDVTHVRELLCLIDSH